MTGEQKTKAELDILSKTKKLQKDFINEDEEYKSHVNEPKSDISQVLQSSAISFNDLFTKKRKKSIVKKPLLTKRFSKKEIPKLNYGVFHSQYKYPDGVSIVMDQIDYALREYMGVPKGNIYYFAGRSKKKDSHIKVVPDIWIDDPVNKLTIDEYRNGFGGDRSEAIELQISKVKGIIKEFIEKNKIDVIIAHNTSHNVNFVLSVALHRYYRDQIAANRRTPKYILWWHDSHLERKMFSNPAPDVDRYLVQGVPGYYVEHYVFINGKQFANASDYFEKLDRYAKGYSKEVEKNHSVIYNTTSTFIGSFSDLKSDKFSDRVEAFFNEFKVRELLKENNVGLSNVTFCLQHTRIVDRKRIDFALEYAFKLFDVRRKKDSNMNAMYFFVSGHSADKTKRSLKYLHRRLCKQYNTKKFFLVFVDDIKRKINISFEEYPRIFAKLGGFSTYFSEVEGFGNNLLEVMASGLVPVVYKYPVFKTDIEKYNFKLIALDQYELNDKSVTDMIDILNDEVKRKRIVDYNLRVLNKNFSHKIIAVKLKRAIIKSRLHI